MKNEEIEIGKSHEWWMLAQLALVIIGIGFAIWIAFLAPCSSLGWVPLKDLPARCIH